MRASGGSLFSSPSLWAMALYYFCGSFGWSFFVSWMPRYMKEVHGVTFEKSEWSSAWPLLCGGIACLVGGVLSDALVKRTRLAAAWPGRFPDDAVAWSRPRRCWRFRTPRRSASATILMCVAAAAFDFGQAANWAAIVDIGGRNAGIAMGFINMVGNLGNAVQPYVGRECFNTFRLERAVRRVCRRVSAGDDDMDRSSTRRGRSTKRQVDGSAMR